MAVNAATISTGGAGGGVAGIPGGWRTVVIAGGALAALLAVLLQRSRGASSSQADDDPDAQLGPNAQLAIGQIAYDQRVAFGEASMRDAEMAGALASLASAFETSSADAVTRYSNLAEGQAGLYDLLRQQAGEAAQQRTLYYQNLAAGQAGIYGNLAATNGLVAALAAANGIQLPGSEQDAEAA